MNLVDCTVTKILTEPYLEYDKWFVNVQYDCYGSTYTTSIMFNEKESAEKVSIGYVFQA